MYWAADEVEPLGLRRKEVHVAGQHREADVHGQRRATIEHRGDLPPRHGVLAESPADAHEERHAERRADTSTGTKSAR